MTLPGKISCDDSQFLGNRCRNITIPELKCLQHDTNLIVVV